MAEENSRQADARQAVREETARKKEAKRLAALKERDRLRRNRGK